MADIVPFGKYRGRPVAEMLADQSYMQWLEAQPWFKERYGWIVVQQVHEDQVTQTPEHNRLQALFLDWRYRASFITASGIREKMISRFVERREEIIIAYANEIDAMEKHLSEHDYGERWITNTRQTLEAKRQTLEKLRQLKPPAIRSGVEFEVGGCDLMMAISYYSEDAWRLLPSAVQREEVRLEIKPTVADDYPAVLRQMKRHKSTHLFIVEYQGIGADQEEFEAIFAASRISVVFKADIDEEYAILCQQYPV